jgi:hypothetical protein
MEREGRTGRRAEKGERGARNEIGKNGHLEMKIVSSNWENEEESEEGELEFRRRTATVCYSILVLYIARIQDNTFLYLSLPFLRGQAKKIFLRYIFYEALALH